MVTEVGEIIPGERIEQEKRSITKPKEHLRRGGGGVQRGPRQTGSTQTNATGREVKRSDAQQARGFAPSAVTLQRAAFAAMQGQHQIAAG